MSAKVNRVWNCNDPACVVYLPPTQKQWWLLSAAVIFQTISAGCTWHFFFPPLIQWADLFLCESGCRATSQFRNNSITDWQSECVTDLFLSACRSRLIFRKYFLFIFFLFTQGKNYFVLKPVITLSCILCGVHTNWVDDSLCREQIQEAMDKIPLNPGSTLLDQRANDSCELISIGASQMCALLLLAFFIADKQWLQQPLCHGF